MMAVFDWITDRTWRTIAASVLVIGAGVFASFKLEQRGRAICADRCAPLDGFRFVDIHACVCVEEDGALRLLRGD